MFSRTVLDGRCEVLNTINQFEALSKVGNRSVFRWNAYSENKTAF